MTTRLTFFRKLALAAAVVFAAGCAPEQKIVIVSTNDMHSAIDNFPKLAYLVDSLRAANPGRFLLIDAGDRWTGNPYVDYATEPGRPIIELMNELGYDIATFGNHEWDNGTPLLAERTQQADFDKVLANADMLSTPMPRVPAYMIKTAGGLKIAFLGLVSTEDNGHPSGKAASFEGITFADPWDTAARYKHLRDSADLYVAITHIGMAEDSLLAEQRPEIDLIIGGHSHDTIPQGLKIRNTVVTQAGKNLGFAGVTVVTYRGNKIRKIENRAVELAPLPDNARFRELVDGYYNNPYFKEVVGSTLDGMNKTALMNLYSDIMRLGAGAKFAFYNMGGMRTASLPAGSITRGDVFAAEPFRNMPNTFMMELEEIKDLILNKFNSEGKESHTLDLYPSGMTYRIITDGEGRATDVMFAFNGQGPEDQKYVVALSDYVSGAYRFSQKGGGESTGRLITDLAQDYIRRNSPLRANNSNRVEIE